MSIVDIENKRAEVDTALEDYKQAKATGDLTTIEAAKQSAIAVCTEYSRVVGRTKTDNPELTEDELFSDPVKLSPERREFIKGFFDATQAYTSKYLVVETLGHRGDAGYINEIILYKENEVIPFSLVDSDDYVYDTATGGVPLYWNHSSNYTKAGINDGIIEWSSDTSTALMRNNTSPELDYKARFILLLPEDSGVDKVEFYTGQSGGLDSIKQFKLYELKDLSTIDINSFRDFSNEFDGFLDEVFTGETDVLASIEL